MALNAEQKKRFNSLRRAGKTDRAKQFRDGILNNRSGAQNTTTAGRYNVNPQNVNNVLNQQDQANTRATQQSTPNVNTYQGNQSVAYDASGQPTVSRGLNPQLQQEFNAQRDFRGTQTYGASTFANQAIRQGAFNPASYVDPRTSQPAVTGDHRSGIQQAQITADPRQGIRQANTTADPRQGIQQAKLTADARQGLEQVALPNDYRQNFEQMYDAQMSRFKDQTESQFANEREKTLQSLINRGHQPGSEQYEREMKRLNEIQNSATLNATDVALRNAGSEQSRMFGDTLQGRGQMYNENLNANNQNFGQQFQNADQRFGQNATANNQIFGQQYQNADQRFNQNAVANDQRFGQQYQNAGQSYEQAFNANNQRFGQQSTNAQNAYAQNVGYNDQRFNQAYQTYQAPYSSMQAFAPYAGQFSDPNFGAVQSIATNPTDLTGYSAQYLADQGATQRQAMQNRASLESSRIGAGATLGSAGIGANAQIQGQLLRTQGDLQNRREQQRIDQENLGFQQGLGF